MCFPTREKKSKFKDGDQRDLLCGSFPKISLVNADTTICMSWVSLRTSMHQIHPPTNKCSNRVKKNHRDIYVVFSSSLFCVHFIVFFAFALSLSLSFFSPFSLFSLLFSLPTRNPPGGPPLLPLRPIPP